MIWRFRGRELTFERVRIMGVLNATPDSFSDGGRYLAPADAVRRVLEMEQEGADLIDLGGESTRPGAGPVSSSEEIHRILPILRAVRPQTRLPLSVDTTKPEVARAALEAGCEIINDVDGLNAASGMADVAREFQAGLVLMHRRGGPRSMQQWARYEDVAEEVFNELDQSFRQVLERGVAPEQAALDPGIGFSKDAEQNLELLARLKRFQSWGRPILVGPSRKSFIGNLIGRPPEERDAGTAAAVALAVAQGVQLVRVHNVAMMKDAVRVAEAIVREGSQADVRA